MGGHRAREQERLPAQLSHVNLSAAGIDVGSGSHFAAVPQGRCGQPVREFEAFTADLYRLANWDSEFGVETVVMESTKLDKIKNLLHQVRGGGVTVGSSNLMSDG